MTAEHSTVLASAYGTVLDTTEQRDSARRFAVDFEVRIAAAAALVAGMECGAEPGAGCCLKCELTDILTGQVVQ